MMTALRAAVWARGMRRVDVVGVVEVWLGGGEEEEKRVNANASSSPPVIRRYSSESEDEESEISCVHVIAF